MLTFKYFWQELYNIFIQNINLVCLVVILSHSSQTTGKRFCLGSYKQYEGRSSEADSGPKLNSFHIFQFDGFIDFSCILMRFWCIVLSWFLFIYLCLKNIYILIYIRTSSPGHQYAELNVLSQKLRKQQRDVNITMIFKSPNPTS